MVIALANIAPQMAQETSREATWNYCVPKVINFHVPVGVKGTAIGRAVGGFYVHFFSFL